MSFSEKEENKRKKKSPCALAKECLAADIGSNPPVKGGQYLLEIAPHFLAQHYPDQLEAICFFSGAGYAMVELAMSDDHELKKRGDLDNLAIRLKNGQIVAKEIGKAINRLNKPELSNMTEDMNFLASHFGMVRSALEELIREK